MRKIFSILAALMLISIASAAVYITFSPEAKIWWSIDKPGPDVSPIEVLIPFDNESYWTNTWDIESLDGNDDFGTKLRFDNCNPEPVIGKVMFEITCDQGLFISPDGTVRDFDVFTYCDPGLTEYEGNTVGKFEIVNEDTIRFNPSELYEFPAESTKYGRIDIGMVGMAYGNYTCIILMESV